MTKTTEPTSFTRKQFEHTCWFLHHLHAEQLIDHAQLQLFLSRAPLPLADTGAVSKRAYKKKNVSVVSSVAEVSSVVKPKRTYKRKTVVATAEVSSIVEVAPIEPKRSYNKKTIVATAEVFM